MPEWRKVKKTANYLASLRAILRKHPAARENLDKIEFHLSRVPRLANVASPNDDGSWVYFVPRHLDRPGLVAYFDVDGDDVELFDVVLSIER